MEKNKETNEDAMAIIGSEVDPEKVDHWVDNAIKGNQDVPMNSYYGITRARIMEGAKELGNFLVEYKELMMMSSCAIKEVQTKLEVLNTEYNVKSQRNPINNISSRLKSTNSIIQKLIRNEFEMTVQSIEENLNDIAGIRVVCEYIDNIYTIAEALLSQSDVTLIRKKDYIKNPKPNGYRSLHLIISVPVFFSDKTKQMKVEVQIRTIAMDFWASLEHQTKYKRNIEDQDNIVAELKECADTISGVDVKMMELRNKILAAADAPTEENMFLEQLRKFDVPLS